MALIKWGGQDVWEPFHDLARLEDEVNRVFGRTLVPASKTKNGGAWLPDVDIIEEKDKVLVRADLPGMKQEDISVAVEGDMLTIKGERKQELEKKEGQVHRIECSYGAFLRSFALPSTVDAGKIGAAYKNGVLEVTLPKREESRPKQVKVDVK